MIRYKVELVNLRLDAKGTLLHSGRLRSNVEMNPVTSQSRKDLAFL